MIDHVRASCKDDCGECNLCNLFMCSVCCGAEGSLPTHCPGARMTEQQEAQVYAGELDYREPYGWCAPDGAGRSMGDQDIRLGFREPFAYA